MAFNRVLETMSPYLASKTFTTFLTLSLILTLTVFASENHLDCTQLGSSNSDQDALVLAKAFIESAGDKSAL